MNLGVFVWAVYPSFEAKMQNAYSTLMFDSGRMGVFFICALVSLVLVCIVWGIAASIQEERKEEAVRRLAASQIEIPADTFLRMRSDVVTGRNGNKDLEFTGVYIIRNVTKDMYYVGQSVRVLQRVAQHLTGHGNGNVYADYKHGDYFTVRTISLAASGYQSINSLERDMIAAYHAHESGYNSTRGNRA